MICDLQGDLNPQVENHWSRDSKEKTVGDGRRRVGRGEHSSRAQSEAQEVTSQRSCGKGKLLRPLGFQVVVAGIFWVEQVSEWREKEAWESRLESQNHHHVLGKPESPSQGCKVV